jgi:hypothetical protein
MAAPASATPSSAPLTAATAIGGRITADEDIAIEQAQIPLLAAANRIRSAAARDPGYTDVQLDVPHRMVRLLWHGAMPAAVKGLLADIRRGGTTVRVTSARYGAAELDQAVGTLTSRRNWYLARGIDVVAVRANADGSGVSVGVAAAPAALSPASAPAAQQAMAADVAVPVQVYATRPGTPTDRLADLPSHWAGARIIGLLSANSWEECTTGFPMMRNSDGRTFITTAGHCDNDANNATNFQWWSPDGATLSYASNGALVLGGADGYRMGEAWIHDLSLDVAFIRPPNGAVAGFSYTGNVANDNSDKPVAGVSGSVAGLYTCTSGSYTGVHCNTVVQFAEMDWESFPGGGYWIPMWHVKHVNASGALDGGVVWGQGDSGGPVLTNVANGHIGAVGEMSLGFGNGTKCPAGNDTGNDQFAGPAGVWENDTSTTCFAEGAYVAEQQILNSLGATLLTN